MQRSTVAKGSAVLLVLTLVSWKAEAADRFAMTCLENKTSITLRYKTRWGANDQWESSSISPGSRTSHTWEYGQGKVGQSPTLYLKFDDDLSGKAKWRDKALESYRSPQKTDCHRYGKEYHFHYDGSARKYIDLVSVR
ncbi:hypothetical protein LJR220_003977 [Bradyrhizobium sp. LjRoot220]|uniref:hypothetical protein n=1 Tax=Bradyrhizobium sp. LjRoot220 TaxID=3342284 RepID=UPI003ECCDA1C